MGFWTGDLYDEHDEKARKAGTQLVWSGRRGLETKLLSFPRPVEGIMLGKASKAINSLVEALATSRAMVTEGKTLSFNLCQLSLSPACLGHIVLKNSCNLK